jgi:hypothetical protein
LPRVCDGRLTLTSGLAVTVADVTAATTIYFTPFGGDRIATYDDPASPMVGAGGNWILWQFTQMSASLAGLTASLPYDVFVAQTAGVLALSLVAWTNATTRATALVLQDGVYVKTGALGYRYLGTLCMTGTTGQTEDSLLNRLVWNAQNRVPRKLAKLDASGSGWNYTTATWRAANASTSYRVNLMIGLEIEPVSAEVRIAAVSNGTGGVAAAVGIGVDSVTVNSADLFGIVAQTTAQSAAASFTGLLAPGSHFLQWIEISAATGTTAWSLGAAAECQGGLTGRVLA